MELTIVLKARSGKDQELHQALRAFLPAMRQAQGCLDSRIYRDEEEGSIFLISMQWNAITDLDQYLLSNSGSAILGAIDLLAETVKVRFGNENPWGGIEILKRIRSKL